MELFDGVFLQLDEKRIYVYNTLFNLPEIYLLACLIDYFQTNKNYKEYVLFWTIHRRSGVLIGCIT